MRSLDDVTDGRVSKTWRNEWRERVEIGRRGVAT